MRTWHILDDRDDGYSWCDYTLCGAPVSRHGDIDDLKAQPLYIFLNPHTKYCEECLLLRLVRLQELQRDASRNKERYVCL